MPISDSAADETVNEPEGQPSAPAPTTVSPEPVPPGTKTGAVWFGLAVSTLVLIALIVFIAQNTRRVTVRFLGWDGRTPLSVALLIAAAAAALLVVIVGTARILQLRRSAHRQAKKFAARRDPN
jgi:uncharacterized integral membrane protein